MTVRIARLLAGLLAAGVLVISGGTGAQAHDVLVSSDPRPGSVVERAPEAITLTFSAPALAMGTKIVVRTPDGRDAADGAPELVDSTIRQPVAGYLPAGEYTVEWRATSADGHPVDGTFTFSAAGAAGEPKPTATPSPDPEPTAEATTGQPSPQVDPTPSALPTIDPGPRSGGPATFVIGGLFVVLAAGVVAVLVSARRSRGPGA